MTSHTGRYSTPERSLTSRKASISSSSTWLRLTSLIDISVAKFDDTYSADPANLGRISHPALLDALEEILLGCRQLLRPGGLLAG
jgi:hypothetical protein